MGGREDLPGAPSEATACGGMQARCTAHTVLTFPKSQFLHLQNGNTLLILCWSEDQMLSAVSGPEESLNKRLLLTFLSSLLDKI